MMTAQSLLKAYKEKLVTFQKYILQLRKQNEYLLGLTGNAAQTPVIFYILESPRVTSEGEWTAQIRTT
jgi:hypothetical protein